MNSIPACNAETQFWIWPQNKQNSWSKYKSQIACIDAMPSPSLFVILVWGSISDVMLLLMIKQKMTAVWLEMIILFCRVGLIPNYNFAINMCHGVSPCIFYCYFCRTHLCIIGKYFLSIFAKIRFENNFSREI